MQSLFEQNHPADVVGSAGTKLFLLLLSIILCKVLNGHI